MEAFEYTQAHACIESLQLVRSLQCLVTAGSHGLSLIIDNAVRRNTHLTEGRTKLTPFPADVMKRFAPMRAADDRL